MERQIAPIFHCEMQYSTHARSVVYPLRKLTMVLLQIKNQQNGYYS